jgi:ABC-type sugar transport system substrate-binding protein
MYKNLPRAKKEVAEMKKWYKVLCLFLSITMLLSVVVSGCGSNTKEKTSTVQIASTGDQKVDSLLKEVSKLQGEDALKFFQGLESKGLTQDEILNFFINLPLSPANKQINKIYTTEGFDMYQKEYPVGNPYDGYQWVKGSGTDIVGPYSKNNLKLPFTDYVKLPKGPVGDANKTYTLGFVFNGFEHPWLINLADAAKWEASRHSNVKIIVQDAQFDENKWASIVDTFISQKVDGILVWPSVEAPTGPPVDRARKAGIPVVSVDRLTSSKTINSRVTGNFPANGAQDGMYLIWKLAQEGNVKANLVLLRKPLGSTADAVRTGHFLKVLSYFPDINILKSYHDNDDRSVAFTNAQSALQAYSNIDAFYGTGDHQALAALQATQMANRMNSRADGKKIIFLSMDDSKECQSQVTKGLIEVNTPYTPLISDIGIRVLLNIVTGSAKMPFNVNLPNIPMVTQKSQDIFGIKTQTTAEWAQYAFGAAVK